MPVVLYELMGLQFEWDSEKAQTIFNKHNITLKEACSVFMDTNEVTLIDYRFDDDEQRYITIGFSNQVRLLVVAWTQRAHNIRIITAMKAGVNHEKRYARR